MLAWPPKREGYDTARPQQRQGRPSRRRAFGLWMFPDQSIYGELAEPPPWDPSKCSGPTEFGTIKGPCHLSFVGRRCWGTSSGPGKLDAVRLLASRHPDNAEAPHAYGRSRATPDGAGAQVRQRGQPPEQVAPSARHRRMRPSPPNSPVHGLPVNSPSLLSQVHRHRLRSTEVAVRHAVASTAAALRTMLK